MSKEFLKFADVEIKKRKFPSSKGPIDVGDVNIDKIVISNKFSCTKRGSKYFVGYKNIEELTQLCVFLPKMSRYSKKFDDVKSM